MVKEFSVTSFRGVFILLIRSFRSSVNIKNFKQMEISRSSTIEEPFEKRGYDVAM